jgi:acyl carrier protein
MTLAAYFVSRASLPPNASELREFMAQRLPQYMVPAVFVRLEELPLSVVGKIDRGALPKPASARPALRTAYVPPSNDIEVNLATIWAQVLSLDSVGVLDNFFELGGHSLALSTVVSRVMREMGLKIPTRLLLECYTIADMSVRIAEHRGNATKAGDLAQIVDEVSCLSEEDAARLLAPNANNFRGPDS